MVHLDTSSVEVDLCPFVQSDNLHAGNRASRMQEIVV